MSEGGRLAKMVALEGGGEQGAYSSVDDLEWVANETPALLIREVDQLRIVFESWDDRTGGVFFRKNEG